MSLCKLKVTICNIKFDDGKFGEDCGSPEKVELKMDLSHLIRMGGVEIDGHNGIVHKDKFLDEVEMVLERTEGFDFSDLCDWDCMVEGNGFGFRFTDDTITVNMF